MRSRRKDKLPATGLRDTHLQVYPFISSPNTRYLAFCPLGFHLGVIPPSTYFGGEKHCNTGCNHVRRYELPPRDFQEESLRSLLSTSANLKRNTPTVYLYPLRDEDNKRFLWVLDRGERVYLLKDNCLSRVTDLEKDHFRLYL